MICPSCQRDFWALFLGLDTVYRCRACRDEQDRLTAVPLATPVAKAPPPQRVSGPTFKSTPGPACGVRYRSPYISRVDDIEARRAANKCIKASCDNPAQEYSPGNFSCQCEKHNLDDARKRRAASARRRLRNE